MRTHACRHAQVFSERCTCIKAKNTVQSVLHSSRTTSFITIPCSAVKMGGDCYSGSLIGLPTLKIDLTVKTRGSERRGAPHTAESRAGSRVGLIYIADIYHWYISDIYIRYFRLFLNVTHCDYVLIFSLYVLLAYDWGPQHFLNVGQLLSDCTSPQQCSVNDKSTPPDMQCTHTYYYLVVNFI